MHHGGTEKSEDCFSDQSRQNEGKKTHHSLLNLKMVHSKKLHIHPYDREFVDQKTPHYSSPRLLSLSLRFEVKAIAAGALDGADGGAIETQKGFAALGALEVFLNHMHVPFSNLQIIKFLLQHFYSFFAAFSEESA